jgi:uncharacterized protein YaeQ
VFGSTTMQVRLALSAIDRGLDLNLKLMVARRPDEPMAHVVMRVLGFCIFYRSELNPPLKFAPSPADRDCPDLWAHDLIGRPIEWIVCGKPDVEELRHVLKHQRQAAVRVLFGAEPEREAFFHELGSLRKHVVGLESVDFRQVDSNLVDRLAACEQERQGWAVTLVEDHLYVDAEGVPSDSEVARIKYIDERRGR